MKLFNKIAVICLAVTVLACNKTQSDNYDIREQQSFDLWMAKKYPHVTNRLDNGMYYEWLRGNGTGTKLKDGTDWMVLDAYILDKDSNVILTRDSMVAKREGTFSRVTHYIPHYAQFNTEANSFTQGEYAALAMMARGDSIRIYLPSMLAYNAVTPPYSTGFEGWQYSSLNPKNGGNNVSPTYQPVIMNLSLREIVNDPEAYELAQVKERARQLGYGSDADTIRPGLYFKLLEQNEPADKIGADSTVYFRYVIRFLDGKLMTTNVDSIALKEWGDYGEKYSDQNMSAVKGSGNEAIVSAVNEVMKSEKALYNSTMQMVFTSKWGFGSSLKSFSSGASSSSVSSPPNAMVYPYTPLIMEITTQKYGFDPNGKDDEEEGEEEK